MCLPVELRGYSGLAGRDNGAGRVGTEVFVEPRDSTIENISALKDAAAAASSHLVTTCKRGRH